MNTLHLIPSQIEWQRFFGSRKLESAAPALPLQTAADKYGVWGLCGIGPAAAALSTSLLIRTLKPNRIVLLGIAGAMPASGLRPGDLVQASSECFADLGFEDDQGFHTFDEMDMPILSWAGEPFGCTYDAETNFEHLPSLPFITVSSVTNSEARANKLYDSFNAAVENMEGAGVAMAAQLHGVAFSEVRAISNIVGPRDPKNWRINEAIEALRDLYD